MQVTLRAINFVGFTEVVARSIYIKKLFNECMNLEIGIRCAYLRPWVRRNQEFIILLFILIPH